MASTAERSSLAESAEAEFVLSMARAAPPEVRAVLGMSETRLAGGVVTAMRNDPMGGFWNRALGFGFSQPFDAGAQDEVLAFYEEAQAPAACIQLSPHAAPQDWPTAFAARGLTPGRTWVKFLTPVSSPVLTETALEIRAVDATEVDEYATVYTRGFGMPTEGPFFQWIRALPSAAGWQSFGAWDDGVMISAGNLFVVDGVGVLGGAATLPEQRGKGGQTALMAARTVAATEAGCAWISTETGTETAEEPNPSLHNMRHAGMDELYERTNWIFRPAG